MNLSHRFLRFSFATIACLGLAACGGGGEDGASSSGGSTNSTTGATVALGESLFAVNCAVCHGPTGAGDGAGAVGLAVKPRNLNTEPYKFVPVNDHESETVALVEYLKVGRIESGMPPYKHLKPQELESLALFVESLRPKPNFIDAPPGDADTAEPEAEDADAGGPEGDASGGEG